MANKFILVPEEIYKGLTTHDTGEPNLDFIRRGLEKTKRKKETPSAKNINYNQEFRRYLQLRNEQQNRPVKVEMVASSKGIMARPATSLTEEDDMWTQDFSSPSFQSLSDTTSTLKEGLPSSLPTENITTKEEKPEIKTPKFKKISPKKFNKVKWAQRKPSSRRRPINRFSPALWR